MPTEDFTTYTEVDPNNHISKTASHIDAYLYRNEDAYVYKDKGANHFGTSWEHKIDVKAVAHSDNGIALFWALTNDIDDWQGLLTGNKPALGCEFYWAGTTYQIVLAELKDGTQYATTWNCSGNTWYYLTISRSDSTLTCKVYSDSARTNLLTTLTLTLHTQPSHRYVFGALSRNLGNAYSLDEDVENLDLQEVGGQVYNVYVDAVAQSLSSHVEQCAFSVAKDAGVSSEALGWPEATFNVLEDAVTDVLADSVIEVVRRVVEIFVDAVATAETVPLIQAAFNLCPEAVVEVVAEVNVLKEGEVKVTRLFLVLGDLAVQLTG